MSEIFTPVGHVKNGVLVKHIFRRNILRKPELCFTFDKVLYDQYRKFFRYIRITLAETNETYGITADEFDKTAVVYDYGNGAGYRLPIRCWALESKQVPLEVK